jgi:lysophospholipase L1-like esterase
VTVVRRLLALGIAAVVLAVATACAPVAHAAPAATSPRPSAALSAAPAASHDAHAVVTIGDSIMAGYGLEPGEAWPELLARRTGVPLVNLACSGAGFVAVGDCGTDFSTLVDEAIAFDPAVVIVQASDNDLEEDPHDIDAAAAAAVRELRRALPGAQLVGIGALWNVPGDTPAAITGSTDALRAAMHAAGGVFVSLGQPLQDDQDLLQADGEHPTPEGQRVLAERVRAALDDAGVTL